MFLVRRCEWGRNGICIVLEFCSRSDVDSSDLIRPLLSISCKAVQATGFVSSSTALPMSFPMLNLILDIRSVAESSDNSKERDQFDIHATRTLYRLDWQLQSDPKHCLIELEGLSHCSLCFVPDATRNIPRLDSLYPILYRLYSIGRAERPNFENRPQR